MVIYLKRLVLFGEPKSVIFSSFLPVGPCGQTAYAVLQLGSLMRQVSVSLFPAEESNSVGLTIYGVSIVIALPFWGVGVFWLALANSSVLSMLVREGVPFNLCVLLSKSSTRFLPTCRTEAGSAVRSQSARWRPPHSSSTMHSISKDSERSRWC